MSLTFQFKIIVSSTDFDRDGSTIKNGLRKAVTNLDSIELISLYNSVLNENYVIKDGEIKKKEISYETIEREEYDKNKQSDDYNIGAKHVYGSMPTATTTTAPMTATFTTTGVLMTTTITTGYMYDGGSIGYGTPMRMKNVEYHDVPEEDLPIYRKIRILLDININVNELLPRQALKLIRKIVEADNDIIECNIHMSCKDIPRKDLREVLEKEMDQHIYDLTSRHARLEYDLDKNLELIERVSLRIRQLKP